MEGSNFSVRVAVPEDLPGLLPLCAALWPDEPIEEVQPHMAATLSGVPWSTLPLVLFVAEVWSRGQGAVEIASDTWIDHFPSIEAHRVLGFEVAERAIHFRKSLQS